jgi:fumarate hydratase class II
LRVGDIYMITLTDLLAVTGSGVVLHNALQFLATKLTAVATDVESGDVRALAHDAVSVKDAVQKHDPNLVQAAENEFEKLKGDALAEVAAVRHTAAETLRKLAEDVEKAASAAPAPAAPAAAETPAHTAP